jgi:predicted enzyme related to lactoylglutathione lyase
LESQELLLKERKEMAKIPQTGFNWGELMTTDIKGAANFYKEVAGLTVIPGDYPMLMAGSQPVGGLVGPRPEGPIWPSGGPQPHWVAYLGVEDVEAAVRKAQELKGKVLVPTTKIPGFGMVAVLRDPQGAAFGIFSPGP